MRGRVMVAGTLCLLATSQGSAQSASDFAAWAGLVSTPVAGFASVGSASTGRGFALQARYSHWQFAPDDDNTTNLALGVTFPTGRMRSVVEVGYSRKRDCSECGAVLLGGQLYMPLTDVTTDGGLRLKAELNPSVGLMHPRDDEELFSAQAAALNVLFEVEYPVGTSTRLAPFISPGFGVGRISAEGESETGAKPLIGGGISLSHAAGFHVSAGARRILVEEGETVVGITVTLGR